MEAEIIKLEDFEYFGEGATGKTYNKKDDPNLILKLSNPGIPSHVITDELEMSHKVYSAGVRTPKPGKLVFDPVSGCYGALFGRLYDKISYSRAIGNNPERVEEYARKFADACKELHSIHLPQGLFLGEKQKDLALLESNPFFKPDEKKKVTKFILDAPDADTAIHGDLQYGNIIMSGGQNWFIDLGDFSCGHPLFDLGMVYLCSKASDEQFVKENYHMDLKTAAEFWHWFVYGYWGDDANQKEIEELIRPYAGLKVLIIERNFPQFYPQFHALLDKVTK